MFTYATDAANYGITLFQNGKKEWTKHFVKDETIRATLDSFVDTQTAFVKQIVKTNEVMATAMSKELGKFPKFDFSKKAE